MHQDLMRPSKLTRKNQRVLWLVAFVLFVLVIATTVATYHYSLKSSEQTAASRLALQVEGFTSTLDKYRLLTPLLARRPDILAVFSNKEDDDSAEAAIAEMVRISGMSDAADIQLIFLDGDRLSISNNVQIMPDLSGQNLLARPDIEQAMQGRLGRQFYDDGHNRFFIFSFASRINDKVAGIVSVVVDLGGTQQVWALSPQPIIATEGGKVLLSNRSPWIELDLFTKTQRAHQKGFLVEKSMFGPTLIKPLFFDSPRPSGLTYVAAERKDYVLGWTFYSMEPMTRPFYAALFGFVLSTSIAAFGLGALWVVFNRQLTQLHRRRNDLANSLWLERRVQSRTRELQKTQEGLIHSAKLAAIGQMSTVLSHEYNQPLTAIRTFAENARLLFDTGKEEKGQENLLRIETQVKKLSKLSKNLKSFARRPGVDICAVSVNRVVDESIMLMTPHARQAAIALNVKKPTNEVLVLAGHTRLEQVLVNLIANALDAIKEKREKVTADQFEQPPEVVVEYFKRDEEGVVLVSDNGPGIDRAIADQIFEPFITSKARGVGLGLGLPIAYNLVKGFGGTLQCIEPPSAGMATTFEITLPAAMGVASPHPHNTEEVNPI